MPLNAFLWLSLLAVGGYLLGSVSFAMWIAKSRGIDLRTVGSGNLGATNVGRNLGRKAGFLVYFLDALKGLVPALLGRLIVPEEPWVGVAGGLCAVLGHCFPFYLRFRGGKGVATLSGAIVALSPLTLVLAGLGFVLVLLTTRVMALASISLGLGMPIAFWLLDPERATGADLPILLFTSFAGLFVIYTHRSNLARLFAGTEDRIGDEESNHV